MGDRIGREQEFHDHSYSVGARRRASKFYFAASAGRSHYRDLLEERGSGGDVLECGCGRGGAVSVLRNSARSIVGIDISAVAISMARDAAADGLAGSASIRFEQMDAEALEFPDNSFDLVCGSGILHHLDIAAAMAEVDRVLRPTGSAVFFEPLGHNPLINLYRRLSPSMRSDDEHPLRMSDLRAIEQRFETVRFRYFALSSLVVVPLRRWSWGQRVLGWATSLDAFVFRWLPWMRRLAWIVVLEIRPRDGHPSTTR